MTDHRKTSRRRLGGGIAVSLLLHGLAVAVFLGSFDRPIELAEQEQAIEVTLVAPPADPEGEAEPASEPEPKPPEPEPTPAQEPPAPVQRPELEKPLPSEAPVPTARPLLRLADRDQAPKPEEGREEAEQAKTSAGTKPETPTELARDSSELPDIELPEAPVAEQTIALIDEDNPSSGSDDAGDSKASIVAEAPMDATAEILEPQDVKRLLSHSYSEDEVATLSMAGLTREERFKDLCGVELSLQLRNGTPRYDVEYLPNFQVDAGNVVNYPHTAFRRRDGVWFNLAVICEVDDKATRVVRFSYSVGKTVPRSEWAERGFPDS